MGDTSHNGNHQQKLLVWASVFGATGIALGALGAHFLKTKMQEGLLTLENLQTFETAVRYQVYHVFALLFAGLMLEKVSSIWLIRSGYAFITGIFLFSGSLYLLATRTLYGIENWKWLGPVTPLGGICFIIGWGFLAVALVKKGRNNTPAE